MNDLERARRAATAGLHDVVHGAPFQPARLRRLDVDPGTVADAVLGIGARTVGIIRARSAHLVGIHYFEDAVGVTEHETDEPARRVLDQVVCRAAGLDRRALDSSLLPDAMAVVAGILVYAGRRQWRSPCSVLFEASDGTLCCPSPVRDGSRAFA